MTNSRIGVNLDLMILLSNALATVKDGCDGAVERDGTGFNRDDLRKDVHEFVDYLTSMPANLKVENLAWALHMTVFYQRQWVNHLPEGTLDRFKKAQKELRIKRG